MKGTEKQIAWAEGIRADANDLANNIVKKNKEKIARCESKIQSRPERAVRYEQRISELKNEITKWRLAIENLKKCESASAIIDNREKLTNAYPDAVFQRPQVLGNAWARLADNRELKTF